MLANEMGLNVLVQYEKLNSGNAPGIQDSQLSLMLTNAQLLFIQTRLHPKLNSKREAFEETEIRSQGLSALIKDSAFSSTQLPNSLENLKYGSFFTLPRDFMYAILEEVEIDKLDCTEYADGLNKGIYNNGTIYKLNDIVFDPLNKQFYQSIRNNNNQNIKNTEYWKLISGAVVPIDFMSHNDYTEQKYNPFKNPYFDGTDGIVWRMNYSRSNSGYNDPTTVIIDGYEYITTQTNKIHELITDGKFNVTRYRLRYLRFPRNIVVDNLTPINQRHCELDESTHQAIVDICVKLLQQSLNQPINNQVISMEDVE